MAGMTMQQEKAFLGGSLAGPSNGTRTQALFKKAAIGTKQLKKAAPAKAATKTIKKAATIASPKKVKKASEDGLWLPNTVRPAWLDGTLPGDRGFDPLGLAKPTEYLQVDLDQLDQNKAVNKAGGVIGKYVAPSKGLSGQALQPYDEVFGLQRFRETELIHGRWAMLATLGVIVAEASTGVSWADAGKVELDGAQYLGFKLPFSISQLVWIEAILVGGAEIYRNRELDPQKRIYPGGYFDPLNLAGPEDPERAFSLKTAEIKHGRLAMVSFLGFGVQALVTGEGALGSLAKFAGTFGEELRELEAAL